MEIPRTVLVLVINTSIFTVLSGVVVSLRIWVRFCLLHNAGLEDWLMIVAFVSRAGQSNPIIVATDSSK
jgi:hypothetical protein